MENAEKIFAFPVCIVKFKGEFALYLGTIIDLNMVCIYQLR